MDARKPISDPTKHNQMPTSQLRLVYAVAGWGNVARSRPLKTAETNNTMPVPNSHSIRPL